MASFKELVLCWSNFYSHSHTNINFPVTDFQRILPSVRNGKLLWEEMDSKQLTILYCAVVTSRRMSLTDQCKLLKSAREWSHQCLISLLIFKRYHYSNWLLDKYILCNFFSLTKIIVMMLQKTPAPRSTQRSKMSADSTDLPTDSNNNDIERDLSQHVNTVSTPGILCKENYIG